jgi:hypothetical protein
MTALNSSSATISPLITHPVHTAAFDGEAASPSVRIVATFRSAGSINLLILRSFTC